MDTHEALAAPHSGHEQTANKGAANGYASLDSGGNVPASQLGNVQGVPSGAIMMWSGLLSNIPSGWVLCDGTNGTPNLLDKFVKGVPDAVTDPGATGGSVSKTTAGHTHTGPSHTHTFTGTQGGWGTGSAYAHPTQASGTGNTSNNTDSISDIRPPYYEIAYIMKT